MTDRRLLARATASTPPDLVEYRPDDPQLTSYVFRERRALRLKDSLDAGRVAERTGMTGRVRPRFPEHDLDNQVLIQFLGVPVRRRDVVTGVVRMSRKADRVSFTRQDEEALELFGDLVGLILAEHDETSIVKNILQSTSESILVIAAPERGLPPTIEIANEGAARLFGRDAKEHIVPGGRAERVDVQPSMGPRASRRHCSVWLRAAALFNDARTRSVVAMRTVRSFVVATIAAAVACPRGGDIARASVLDEIAGAIGDITLIKPALRKLGGSLGEGFGEGLRSQIDGYIRQEIDPLLQEADAIIKGNLKFAADEMLKLLKETEASCHRLLDQGRSITLEAIHEARAEGQLLLDQIRTTSKIRSAPSSTTGGSSSRCRCWAR